MKKYIIIGILINLLFSCDLSVQKDTNSWEANIRKLKKMKRDYPAYADMIDTNIKNAENIYKKAQTLSNEKKRTYKINEAKDVLFAGCIGVLKNMKSKIKLINRKLKKLEKLNKGESLAGQILIDETINDAKKTNENAIKVLNTNTYAKDESPCSVVNNTYQELNASFNDIRNQIENINKKREEESSNFN